MQEVSMDQNEDSQKKQNRGGLSRSSNNNIRKRWYNENGIQVRH